MRVLLALSFLVAVPALAQSSTQEVLVTTSATKLPQNTFRRAVLLENRGPNPIWCGFSSTVAVGKAHKVPSGDRFPVNTPEAVWCVAETAAQVTYDDANPTTTGGTVVSEVM